MEAFEKEEMVITDLEAVLSRHTHEADLTYAQILGCLEVVKHYVLQKYDELGDT